MRRRLTITLDQKVYEGICRTVGKRQMSQFVENLIRSHVLSASLDEGYRAMAADKEREAAAREWCSSLFM